MHIIFKKNNTFVFIVSELSTESPPEASCISAPYSSGTPGRGEEKVVCVSEALVPLRTPGKFSRPFTLS